MKTTFSLSDFDFALPDELIAQHPAIERSASRLLDGRASAIADRRFTELPDLLQPGDLLVFNDTQVVKARLFGQKQSGGKLELLIERVLSPQTGAAHEGASREVTGHDGAGYESAGHEVTSHKVTGREDAGHKGVAYEVASHEVIRHEVAAHMKVSKKPLPGAVLQMDGGFTATLLGRWPEESGPLYRFKLSDDPYALMAKHGHVPLPPYITHSDSLDDEQRYQTVFAKNPGAVAAPTAALHFDEAILARLEARGIARASVTLHVGAGTFQPVKTDNLAEHHMHFERFEVPQSTHEAIAACKARGGRVVAVGTTTVRALESAAKFGPSCDDTNIFITPGFQFQVVDVLLTNFHLPKSTLMMLVSAFSGYEHIMALYRHAIEQRYRFFSYGDAMLLARQTPPAL